MATVLMDHVTEDVQLLFIPCAVCALVSTSNGLGVRDDQLDPGQIITASMVSPSLIMLGTAAKRQCIVLHTIRSSLLRHAWPTTM
jgi:flagellar biosynthesis protein FliP